MTGEATLKQLMESLRRYTPRSVYVQKTLFKLFGLSSGLAEPREDIIKVLIWSYLTTNICSHLLSLIMLWGTLDVRIKDLSAENPELSKVVSFKPGADRVHLVLKKSKKSVFVSDKLVASS